MLILQQMAIFFLLMLCGIAARSRGIISADIIGKLTAIAVNICTPAMILACKVGGPEAVSFSRLLHVTAVIILANLALIAVGFIAPYLLRCRREEFPLYNMMTVCTNTALIGLPFTKALFGDEALFCMSIEVIVSTFMMFTYGVYILKPRGSTAEVKLKVININVVACVIMIIMAMTSLSFPYVLDATVTMLGGAAPPFAMLLLGATLYDCKIRDLIKDLKLWWFCALKMIILPVLLLWVFRQIVTDRVLLSTLLVIFATPSGVVVSLLCNLLQPKLSLLASKLISVTTAVAVLTIPLVNILGLELKLPF